MFAGCMIISESNNNIKVYKIILKTYAQNFPNNDYEQYQYFVQSI